MARLGVNPAIDVTAEEWKRVKAAFAIGDESVSSCASSAIKTRARELERKARKEGKHGKN